MNIPVKTKYVEGEVQLANKRQRSKKCIESKKQCLPHRAADGGGGGVPAAGLR